MNEIEERSLRVISIMKGIPEISHLPIDGLSQIPLGLIRATSFTRHAVCRFRKGTNPLLRKPDINDVRCIDIHPLALTDEWSDYADFLLYHEYLHALGYFYHDAEFRRVEALWPIKEACINAGSRVKPSMGNRFAEFLFGRRPDIFKWVLVCPSCQDRSFSRYPSTGKNCSKCKSTLVCIERQKEQIEG